MSNQDPGHAIIAPENKNMNNLESVQGQPKRIGLGKETHWAF